METLDLLQRRRSSKKFGQKVPNAEQLENMFKAAVRAPDHGRLTDKNGMAPYFSRATIPFGRNYFPQCDDAFVQQQNYLRHIGIYAYRAGFVKQYVAWEPTALEQLESLEQLRALWYGEKIHLDLAKEAPQVGVDTAEDLERVRQILA